MKIINPNSLKQELIVTLLMIPTIGVIILIGYFAVQYYGDKVGVSITIVLLLAIFPTLMIVGNIIQIIKFKTKNTNLDSLDSGTHEIVGRIKPIGKLVESPTGKKCVFYSSFWLNTVYVGSGDSGNYKELLVSEQYDNCTFVVEDKNSNIELDLSKLNTHAIRICDIDKLKIKNSQRSDPIGNIKSERYEEVVLMPNDEFYFNGTIEEVIIKEADKTSAKPIPPLLTKTPTGSKLFKVIKAKLIGNKSEKKLIKKRINKIIIALVVLIIFLMVAVGLHSTKFME